MSELTLRVAVAGASGRMGHAVIEAVLDNPTFILTGALVPIGNAAAGSDAGAFLGRETGIKVSTDIDEVISKSDFLIDFTCPEGTLSHLKAALLYRTCLVIGTTGFTFEQKKTIESASNSIGIVFSPNMSVGVNVVFKLLSIAAAQFSQGYDVEIIEAHHRNKVDAPSGTALKMGEVIADAIGYSLDNCAVYARAGNIGSRKDKTIGFSTIRGGDIVGDHTAMFAGVGERIEISHISWSRRSYAEGSLRAVRFLSNYNIGLYDMQDVLNLH